MTIAIQTAGLTKVLNGVSVVKDVSLSIPEGTICGVVGANGAGKTTLLRLLHGIMWPTSGEIQLFGQPMPRESAPLRQRIGYVASEGTIYPSFRVQDLIEFSASLYERWDAQRCRRLLDALQLPKRQLIRQLSLGMRMQLRLVIRLCTHPDVLLLDEPTNGLDAVIKRQFLQLILDEALNDGTTIVMATHLLPDLERMADSVVVMYKGRMIADGVIDDLKTKFRGYQVVLPNGMPSSVAKSERVLQTEQRGAVWTVIVDDIDGELEQVLRQASTHFETVPQSLEDIFTHVLRREGYSREAILLS
ncbi:ABC transporter ATP-binding protein [Alicyclobacillus curvatus]|nr:ABC transporter ATP-binding protein [Alicyclobacillus curvatus]